MGINELIEVRKDFIVPSRISIISKVRGLRPKEFKYGKTVRKTPLSECPFCPGNEFKTPPATLVVKLVGREVLYLKDSNNERVRDWKVRIFPNKYPALTTLGTSLNYGYHEVIVETPEHIDLPYVKDLNQYVLVFKAIVKRFTDILKDPKINHVILIKNYGPLSGASLEHPHMQFFATSFPLPYVVEEITYSTKYYKDYGRCPYCELISKDLCSSRFIYSNERFVILSARAPRSPYEVWVLPKKHERSFINITDEEIRYLVDALQKILKAYEKCLGNPSFNLWLHTSPKKLSKSDDYVYHWHIEISPILTTWGGFEKGSGTYIIPVSPEKAGEYLKKCISELI